MLNTKRPFILFLIFFILSCVNPGEKEQHSSKLVAEKPTSATAKNGKYISWKEHIIDDTEISGVNISGSDGLVMADLDLDGFEDIISVHESDTHYDGNANGHIRIAFGSADPDQWELVTLAEGPEAGAAEDVDVADLNGDGFPDIIAACELAHLIYFQNPGSDIRRQQWPRIIPSITKNRGSFIRVFFADFNEDGIPEITSPNKGDQSPGQDEPLNTISWFEINGDPLQDTAWTEHILTKVKIPINAQPLDLDGDGDLDLIGGAWGEGRILWFENKTDSTIQFIEHPIHVEGSAFTAEDQPEQFKGFDQAFLIGFNMDFHDFNKDGRLDILLTENLFGYLVWLQQPANPNENWLLHPVGTILPDQLVGFILEDINDDGHVDIMTGAYSRGPREEDGDATVNDDLGRLAWFENSGETPPTWTRHDISRRKRGMFDKFIARDMDGDGDTDFVGTRGNSLPYDGVFWLEQVRSAKPKAAFTRARENESAEMPLPENN